MAMVIVEPEVVGIDKSTIEGFLGVIPREDIDGLREIRITDVCIVYDTQAFYDPREKRIGICAPRLNCLHDTRKPAEVNKLAFLIFHEISHHIQQRDHRQINNPFLTREHLANSYAEEKLKKLKLMNPDFLSPYAWTRSLIQTRLGGWLK